MKTKEEIAAYQAEYRNRPEVIAKCSTPEYKDLKRARQRARYKKNAEKCRANTAKYRAKPEVKEAKAAYNREYWKKRKAEAALYPVRLKYEKNDAPVMTHCKGSGCFRWVTEPCARNTCWLTKTKAKDSVKVRKLKQHLKH
jgi:hypothetical protein